MLSLDLLQRGNTDSDNDGDRQPRQDDERRKPMDRPRYPWSRELLFAYVFVAHADFSRQEVKAFTWLEVLLGFDLTVHDDAAANVVTIALRHDTSHGRRLSDREIQRPGQTCSLNVLRFSIDVEIADVRHRPW